MIRKLYFIVWILTFATLANAQKSGWLTPKEGLKLMTYYSRYNADSFRDKKGNLSKYGNNGKFASDYFKLTAEYGLLDNINLYAALPLVYDAQTSAIARNYKLAFGDSELGLMANLIKWKRAYLIGSLSGSIPLYAKNSIPRIGIGEYAAATSLKYCGSIDAEYRFYFSVESGARFYFNGIVWWTNQAQLGYHLSKKHSIIAEVSGTKSFGNGAFDLSPNANATHSFYEKVGVGYYYKATPRIQFGGTWWTDVIDRNSSVGRGFSAIAIFNL